MEVQVTITLSDKLFELLEDKLPNLGRRVEKALTKELGKQARAESEITVHIPNAADLTDNSETPEAPVPEASAKSEKPRRARRAKAEAPEVSVAPAETAGEVPEPEAPVTPAEPQAAPAPQKKDLSVEDVRDAIHRTRQRIEGEDYKENTDSEAYKKYHKQLTGVFKQISIPLGADKPSFLQGTEQIATFIAACDELIIGEDGNIITPPAAF